MIGWGTPTVLSEIGYDLDQRDLLLGAYSSGTCDYRFQGDVDEMQIYFRALSAEEIAAIYAVNQ